jgi:hypothetical protein
MLLTGGGRVGKNAAIAELSEGIDDENDDQSRADPAAPQHAEGMLVSANAFINFFGKCCKNRVPPMARRVLSAYTASKSGIERCRTSTLGRNRTCLRN